MAKKDSSFHVLLLKTNKERGGYWQNVTGNVEEKEHFIDASRRELFEETGVSSKNLVDLNIDHTFLDRWDRNIIEKSFLVLIPFSSKIIISKKEHDDYQWIEISEIKKSHYKFSSNYESLLKAQKYEYSARSL